MLRSENEWWTCVGVWLVVINSWKHLRQKKIQLDSPSCVFRWGPSWWVYLPQDVWSHSRRSNGRGGCCTCRSLSEETPDLRTDEGPPRGGPRGYRRPAQRKGVHIADIYCGNIQLEVSLTENKSPLMRDQKVKKSQGSFLLVMKQLGCMYATLSILSVSGTLLLSQVLMFFCAITHM